MVAELTEPCALASVDEGRRHPHRRRPRRRALAVRGAPAMLSWPVALAPDNHPGRVALTPKARIRILTVLN
ncbi:MAG: hypothetical protein U1F67_15290 [Rubrivivax sp.]